MVSGSFFNDKRFLLSFVAVAFLFTTRDFVNSSQSWLIDRCSYTIVIDEAIAPQCPVMRTEAAADVDLLPAKLPPLVTSYSASCKRKLNTLLQRLEKLQTGLHVEVSKTKEYSLKLSKHQLLLKKAEDALHGFHRNFTALFKALVYMEKKIHGQKEISRKLNNKMGNIVLDVMEVNNIISTKPLIDIRYERDTNIKRVVKVSLCHSSETTNTFKDCQDAYTKGHTKSGIYYITPKYLTCSIPVWCDMHTSPGGWLVIHRRMDGSVDFNRNWNEYRAGFGSPDKEFWIGNNNLFLLTNQDEYELRVDLWDFKGNRVYANYRSFKVEGERDKYRLYLYEYSGSAGDSFSSHNYAYFSTRDKDNDQDSQSSCANEWKGGWWYKNCWFALLNGPYKNNSRVFYQGISWKNWKHEQLKKAEMKIRPKY